jgi:predicted metal-dependent phosphoesterase TrpH
LEARDSDALFARVAELKDAGICGIEAYYPTHSKEQTAVFLRIAEALDLIVTAGTDFHGRAKPGIELGCMLNGKPAPYSIVEGLKQAAQRARI